MPAKNSIKIYVEDTFYHIYNRGVEKRIIFLDEHDYNTFIFYLKLYLSPPGFDKKQRIRKTFHHEITLHSFCLMPNHFHLLIHQQKATAITDFMRALSTSYSMYFNKKYKRVGSLLQGKYKASLVDNDSYLLALSRYIHHNPASLAAGSDPASYPYSSYKYFMNGANVEWLKKNVILGYFNNDINDLMEFFGGEEENSLPNDLILEEEL